MNLMANQSLRITWLGEAQVLAGRPDGATESARRALGLSREQKERGHEAYALRLLGKIGAHRDPPHTEEAEDCYRQALAHRGAADRRGARAAEPTDLGNTTASRVEWSRHLKLFGTELGGPVVAWSSGSEGRKALQQHAVRAGEEYAERANGTSA